MRYQKGKKDWKRALWGSNVFTIILVVLLAWSFVRATKEILLRYEINQEIKHLEGQLADLEGKTDKVDQLISYLKTDEYIEKEARLKLNLSKPGEKQINLAPTDQEHQQQVIDRRSNVLKWFNYFFK